jgi:hypothetical protein
MAMKRWLRRLNGFVSLLALALLLLIAAWLASNWHDAPPQPRSAALQLPSPTLPDDRNMYFAFAGLRAAPDRDPSNAGQALWKLQLARAVTTRANPFAPAADASANDVENALGKTLPSMAAKPLACTEHMDACVAQWIDNADALDTQRRDHAVLGQRCERLLDGDLPFEEALAPMRTVAEPLAQHGVGASDCSKWFLSGAVLAWAQRDQARTIALLAKADRMNRALLNGSHSLIGQMIAIRVTRNTLGAVAALAVRDPSLSTALMPLLAPLPDQVQSVKRWMVVEAAFSRGVNAEISAACDGLSMPPLADNQPASEVGTLPGWLCRHRIGWHPERNAQAIDAFWLRSIRQLDDGVVASIRAHATEGANHPEAGVLDLLTWRNTLGSAVLSIGQSVYGSYLARHADLELHHESTALALKAVAARTPPAQRRVWLAQQALSPLARGRIALSDDGLVLSARTWCEPFGPGAYDAKRDAIRITWPSPR